MQKAARNLSPGLSSVHDGSLSVAACQPVNQSISQQQKLVRVSEPAIWPFKQRQTWASPLRSAAGQTPRSTGCFSVSTSFFSLVYVWGCLSCPCILHVVSAVAKLCLTPAVVRRLFFSIMEMLLFPRKLWWGIHLPISWHPHLRKWSRGEHVIDFCSVIFSADSSKSPFKIFLEDLTSTSAFGKYQYCNILPMLLGWKMLWSLSPGSLEGLCDVVHYLKWL